MKNIKRKLQISNGHYLDFDQLARLIHSINSSDRKLSMSELEELSGLPFRQVRNRISIGRAMGIFEPKSISLSAFGKLVALHDNFMESNPTLEYIHYLASSNSYNLVWFEVFNSLLVSESSKDYEGWLTYFRKKLAQFYTEHSIKDHVGKEIRFIIDAYIERNFNKLELLFRGTDGMLFRKRYTAFNALILCAMIYDYCTKKEAHLFQVGELAATPGSPARVFGLDVASFRQQIEGLHDRGWLRYETTHNLDQIRLKPGLTAISFLSAHFEDREPREDTIQSPGDIFQ